MRVLIATVKVPFIRGGTEAHAAGLLRALQARGCEADIVEIPFKHYPPERILDHVLACRLLDLSEAFGNTIDRLIGLKFPAYAVPHPHKVLWILHQHRPAYDLWEHPQAGDLKYAPNGCYIRDAIRQADREFIGEARAVFANSRNVAERLRLGCGITAEPLYHPPPGAESFYCERARDYILFPSRINLLKRQKLAIEALALTREPVRLMFIGAADSPELESECARLASHLGVASRIDWMGAVPEQAKYDAYARCLGVLFPPLDEDYGYVTLEAMLSSKSVSRAPIRAVRSSSSSTGRPGLSSSRRPRRWPRRWTASGATARGLLRWGRPRANGTPDLESPGIAPSNGCSHEYPLVLAAAAIKERHRSAYWRSGSGTGKARPADALDGPGPLGPAPRRDGRRPAVPRS